MPLLRLSDRRARRRAARVTGPREILTLDRTRTCGRPTPTRASVPGVPSVVVVIVEEP